MRRAYSLIETIVVLALMALMIGLMLPALQKVRSSANNLVCKNNLRQIRLAMHMYYDSYKFLPYARTSRPPGRTAAIHSVRRATRKTPTQVRRKPGGAPTITAPVQPLLPLCRIQRRRDHFRHSSRTRSKSSAVPMRSTGPPVVPRRGSNSRSATRSILPWGVRR